MSSEAHATHGTADFWRANHCINSECVYDSGHGGLCSHLEVAGPRKRQAVHRYDDAESRPERGARKAPRSRDGRRGKPVELCALGKAEEARCGEVASPPARSLAPSEALSEASVSPMAAEASSAADHLPPLEVPEGAPRVRADLTPLANGRIKLALTIAGAKSTPEPTALASEATTAAEKPPLALLYFKNADDGRLAVSAEVYDRCSIVVFSEREWAAKQRTLEEVCAPIHAFAKSEREKKKRDASYQMKEVRWQQHEYNKDALLRRGFASSTQKTLVAVDDGAGRFAVKYVYWPMDEPTSEMMELAGWMYDEGGCVRRKACGLSEFGARGGGKAERGSMVMFGSHNFIPGAAHKARGISNSCPAAYRFNDPIDERTNVLLRAHVDRLTRLERTMIPAHAEARDRLAAEHDPERLHRMTGECTAFAASLATSYVVTAHDDSGKASETILFTNRSGPLPPNHSWGFAVGGHVHPLPNEMGKAVLLFVEGEGVLHGTLPTSSTEPTLDHGNHGSALVTKKETIDSMARQRERGEATRACMTASKVFLN